jgi:hypothetical protein
MKCNPTNNFRRRLHQQSALSNGEFRFRCDAEKVRCLFDTVAMMPAPAPAASSTAARHGERIAVRLADSDIVAAAPRFG